MTYYSFLFLTRERFLIDCTRNIFASIAFVLELLLSLVLIISGSNLNVAKSAVAENDPPVRFHCNSKKRFSTIYCTTGSRRLLSLVIAHVSLYLARSTKRRSVNSSESIRENDKTLVAKEMFRNRRYFFSCPESTTFAGFFTVLHKKIWRNQSKR